MGANESNKSGEESEGSSSLISRVKSHSLIDQVVDASEPGDDGEGLSLRALAVEV